MISVIVLKKAISKVEILIQNLIFATRCVHFRDCTSLKGVKSITSIFNRKDPYSILLLIIL